MNPRLATLTESCVMTCDECGKEFQSFFRIIPVCDACVQRILEEGETEIALKAIEPDEPFDRAG